MDSQLLKNLAINGQFAFIPEKSMLATILISLVANNYTIYGNNVILQLQTTEGVSIRQEDFVADSPITFADWGANISLKNLYLDQNVHFAYSLNISKDAKLPYIVTTLKMDNPCLNKEISIQGDFSLEDSNVDVYYLRQLYIQAVYRSMQYANVGDYTQARLNLNNMLLLLQSFPKHEIIATILQDLIDGDKEGQVVLAVNKDNYIKWGQHYLRSLIQAHELHIRHNFKDKSVQIYGGDLFENMRNHIEDKFCSLPPPKPSRASVQQLQHFTQSVSQGTYSTQQSYYCSSGPCFDGNCTILSGSEQLFFVKDARKGDRVMTIDNQVATIVCVLKTLSKNNKRELVELNGGLKITPWHPVLLDKWEFPINLEKPEIRNCHAVYSFVLSNGHIMIINGVKCATLGHGIRGPVIEHPFFGTQAVINNLKKLDGWNRGYILRNSDCTRRDTITGLVNQIV